MTVDARIPLSFQPAQFELPSEIVTRHQSLANLGQRNQIQGQQIRANTMDEEERIMMREQARQAQALMADPNITPEEKVKRAYGINPALGEKLEKTLRDRTTFEQSQQDRQVKIGEQFNSVVGPEIAGLLEVEDAKDPQKQADAYKTSLARLGVHPWIKNTKEGQEFYNSLPKESPGADGVRQFAARYSPTLYQQFNQRKINADRERRVSDDAEARRLREKAKSEREASEGEVNPVTGMTRKEKVAAAQKELDRKSREKVRAGGGGGGKGGLTPYQVEQASRKHDDLQTKEQVLWAQVEELGEIVNTPIENFDVNEKGEKLYIDPKHPNLPTVYSAARMGELKSRIASLKGQAKALAAQQKAIRQRHGFDEGDAAPEAAAAPVVDSNIGVTATDPKTGKQIKWDGKAWVPVN